MAKQGQFIADILDFAIEDGVVHISGPELELFIPLGKFRRSMARAAKALATYDAQRAEVVPIKRRGEHS